MNIPPFLTILLYQSENAQQVVTATILSVRAIAFQQPQMQVAENRTKNHKAIIFYSSTTLKRMEYPHAFNGQTSNAQAKQILQGILTQINGIDQHIISNLRSDLILLLQEHKELQLHTHIDMWKFVLEMNHCLNGLAFFLEAVEAEANSENLMPSTF